MPTPLRRARRTVQNGVTTIALVLGFYSLGPIVERVFFPHYGAMELLKIERLPSRLCWSIEYDKFRPATLKIWRYNLVVLDGRHIPVIPFRQTDGRTPSDREAGPVGEDLRTSLCVQLPDDIGRNEHIAVEGTVFIPGFFDLWDVPYHVPTVTSGSQGRNRKEQ